MRVRSAAPLAAALLALATLAGCGGGGPGGTETIGGEGGRGTGKGGGVQPLLARAVKRATLAEHGRKLVILEGRLGNDAVPTLVDVATTAAEPLVKGTPPPDLIGAAWLSDGRYLLVQRHDEGAGIDSTTRFSVLAADRTTITPLPGLPADRGPTSLSPTFDAKAVYLTYLAGSGFELRLVALDGSSDDLLATYRSGDLDDLQANPTAPGFAFTRTSPGSGGSRVGHVLVADARKTAETEVGEGRSPAWSPDGTRLARIADAGKRSDMLPLSRIVLSGPRGEAPSQAGPRHAYYAAPLLWPDASASKDRILFGYEGYDAQGQLWSTPARPPS